jgi:hypothetical protein
VKEYLEDVTRPDKSTKEDKREPGKAVDAGRLQNIRVYWLAFVVYWVSLFLPYASESHLRESSSSDTIRALSPFPFPHSSNSD